MNVITLTPGSAHLLEDLRCEEDYNGEIMLREKDLTASQRGNLSDLKKKGLVTLVCEDKDDRGSFNWYVVDMTTEVVAPEPDYSDISDADLAILRNVAAVNAKNAAAAAATLDALVQTMRDHRANG
jgi:hypothetical protein